VAVAVILVNYRVYGELDRALTSLRPFLQADDEVVIVDQTSDAARAAEVIGRHPGVRLIARTDNVGFAAGVNLGARASRAPYLLLLNPDARLEGPVVRTLEAWLRDHPDTAVVGPRVLNADGTVQASARAFPGVLSGLAGRSTWLSAVFPNNPLSRRQLPGREATEAIDVDWLAGSCFMTTRSAFERVGGFDEHFFLYWEDADYCRRVAALNLKRTYLPTTAVSHAAGQSAAIARPLAIRAFHDSALHYYVKHAGPVRRLTVPFARAMLAWRCAARLRRAQALPSARVPDRAPTL
jgi:GT2 family glycosyltransferase